MNKLLDIVVIGAGPIGIYAGFYAGLRGLTGLLIEKDSQVGGQAAKYYGDKAVYDFPGCEKTTGAKIVKNLLKQFKTIQNKIKILTNVSIEKLEKQKNIFHLIVNGKKIKTKTICLAVGPGLITHKTIEETKIKNAQINYFVNDPKVFYNQKVVILGGGDSAIDWANELKNKSQVSLIHRRENFRAKASSVANLKPQVNILKPYSVLAINQNKINIQNKNNNTIKTLTFDKILVQYGLKISHDQFKKWGLKLEKGRIKVDGWMKTSVEGIWAVGNNVNYQGKINVIASGLGDVVSAMASIATYIDPSVSPTFYSTDKK